MFKAKMFKARVGFALFVLVNCLLEQVCAVENQVGPPLGDHYRVFGADEDVKGEVHKTLKDHKKDVIVLFNGPDCEVCPDMHNLFRSDAAKMIDENQAENTLFAEVDVVENKAVVDDFGLSVYPVLQVWRYESSSQNEYEYTELDSGSALLRSIVSAPLKRLRSEKQLEKFLSKSRRGLGVVLALKNPEKHNELTDAIENLSRKFEKSERSYALYKSETPVEDIISSLDKLRSKSKKKSEIKLEGDEGVFIIHREGVKIITPDDLEQIELPVEEKDEDENHHFEKSARSTVVDKISLFIDANYKRGSDVVTLKAKTFKKVVAKTEFTLVQFAAPWNNVNEQFQVEYEKLARLARDELGDSRVAIAAFDVGTSQELMEEYNIEIFPTFKWFVKGKALNFPLELTEWGSAQELFTWLKRMIANLWTEVLSNPSAADMLKYIEDAKLSGNSKGFLVFKGDFEGPPKKFYHQAVYGSNAEYRILKNISPEVWDEFFANPSSDEVLFMCSGKGPTLIVPGKKTVEGVQREIRLALYPTLGKFTDLYLQDHTENGAELIMFIVAEKTDPILQTATEFASKLGDSDVAFTFLEAGNEENSFLFEYLSIKVPEKGTTRQIHAAYVDDQVTVDGGIHSLKSSSGAVELDVSDVTLETLDNFVKATKLAHAKEHDSDSEEKDEL